jgi:hypothetical protein
VYSPAISSSAGTTSGASTSGIAPRRGWR